MTVAIPKKNIYLFHGPDNFSAAQKLKHWKREFEKKHGDLNITVFEGKDFTACAFTDAVSTLPFLADKRLVVIEDFLRDGTEEDQKEIAEKLENLPDHCVLVFIERDKADARTSLYKRITKIGIQTPFNDRDLPELITWIKTESAKRGLNMGQREAGILADHIGPDLWQMSQEVEKLALYGATNPVDEAAIEAITSRNISADIFKMTDYLAQKDGRMALKTLDSLTLSGAPLMQIFHMIVRHFRILIQMKACAAKRLDQSQISAQTGLHPYVVKKSLPQIRSFNDEQLSRIYRSLLQIEIDTKSSRIKTTAGDQTELRLSIERLIARLCA